MRNLWSLATLAAVTLCGTWFSTTVCAAEPDTTGLIETIVVTAQKREENIQDVPISITAITGDTLIDRGFSEIGELQYVTPGLTFAYGNTSRIANNSIRGIGTGTFSDSIESSVGVVIDGVVIGRAGGGFFDLADIERIEVLRGPQGTLFGKNASAGVLNVVTKRPAEEFEYNASVSYASENELKVAGSVSAPLGDRVGMRLTGYSNRRDGQVDDVVTGQELNQRDEWGVRGKLEFDLTDRSNLLLIADYSERDALCCTWTTRSISDGRPGSGLFGSGFSVVGTFQAGVGIVADEDNEKVGLSGSFSSQSESKGVSAEYNYDFDGFTFTSISAYREWDTGDNNDADQTTFNLLDRNDGFTDQEQFTQEFRLASASDGPLSWTIGAFFFDQSVSTAGEQSGTFGLDVLGALPPGVILDRSYKISPDTLNYAVFGDITYSVNERLRVLAGLRVQHEEIEVDYLRTSVNPLSAAVIGPSWAPFSQSLEVEDDAVTWRVGLQYDVTDQAMLYATLTQGYKGPGINTNVDTVALQEVDPEVPLSFEIGSKMLLADGRAQLNIAGYFTRFEDFQAESFVVSAGGGAATFDISNAGELETYGIEAELQALITQEWLVSTGISWSEATYKEFDNAACFIFQTAAQGCVGGTQDLGGAPLNNAPEFTINFTTEYDTPIANGKLNLVASASYYYRSSIVSSQDQDPNTDLPSYNVFDAAIGIRDPEDRWRLTVFGKNLFGEEFVESVFDTPFDNGGYSQFLNPASQTYVGLRLSVQG